MPHGMACGTVGPLQAAVLHVSPGSTQMPQLALQHIWPTLHVFGPHWTLVGSTGWPHATWLQVSPGAVQMPQAALQHT